MYADHETPSVFAGVGVRSMVGCCVPFRKTISNAATSVGSAKRYHAFALLPVWRVSERCGATARQRSGRRRTQASRRKRCTVSGSLDQLRRNGNGRTSVCAIGARGLRRFAVASLVTGITTAADAAAGRRPSIGLTPRSAVQPHPPSAKLHSNGCGHYGSATMAPLWLHYGSGARKCGGKRRRSVSRQRHLFSPRGRRERVFWCRNRLYARRVSGAQGVRGFSS